MESDRIKWNARYASEELLLGSAPSRFLAERIGLIESLVPGRRALDLACGEGRNGIFIVRRGFVVTAVDISAAGLAKGRARAENEGLAVEFVEADLDSWAIPGSFDLIVNINFLSRELIRKGMAALTPGGVLLVDTLMEGPHAPPTTNPGYLLAAGELAKILSTDEGELLECGERPEDAAPTASALFRKRP